MDLHREGSGPSACTAGFIFFQLKLYAGKRRQKLLSHVGIAARLPSYNHGKNYGAFLDGNITNREMHDKEIISP